ncbi:malto-oligosyltrehalose synthase [Xanthomonas campestris pv. passiflorae]|uniref:malto-oligosyltrehalose synthase n=1 Tax=Xanthomonas campestris TaxID=339 RepID=UPI002421D25A|nr:malto-oligosyltrehalose synthase [Xanthomonas campestris]MBV6813412.1 malto-oligosyltrehalose synthase [Xanthomonas campestris pv. passiflorae]
MIDLRATARLQLHAGFTLHDALAQVPYYAGLGISHLYLSPIGTAVPGSTHGYDNIDPTVVNPELGGEEALVALSQAAREHGMGLIADIVPNHMATHAQNAWWWDVLRNGRSAKHADWFDIDWRAPGRDGKLWLAVLDRPYATALAEGLITLVIEDDGSAALAHYDQRYPIRPQTLDIPEKGARAQWLRDYNDGAKRGDGRLHKLIERQPYRLNWWRVGNDMLNYRRFFDITSLVALRVELPAVFDAVHALPLRLVAEGHLDGLRIDHVDGLTDPTGYVRKLRSRLDAAGRTRGLKPGTLGLYLEKILAPGEHLPADWPCDGTTGYDFMDQVGGLLHDAAGFKPLARAWQKLSGRSGDFAQEERTARDEILRGPLQSEFNRAVGALSALARLDPPTREFSPQMLARGLCVLLRWFPVYRTYAGAKGITGSEAERLRATAAKAREGMPESIVAAVDAIERWLLDDAGADRAQIALRRILRRRVEQLSAPLNAKSVEDTAFYRHGVLLSRNEVGSHPTHFANDAAEFHAQNLERAKHYPRALLATATHDHKRGEDLRMRLAVLSEQPRWWIEQSAQFDALADALQSPALAGGDQQMLWQTLVAAWPIGLGADQTEPLASYAERIAQWLLKAVREAKLHTSWTDGSPAYEQAVQATVEQVLCSRAGLPLRRALLRASNHIAAAGARNSLVQTTLRLTVPGVPDLYQGTEGWDLSLVDPDNRRPVDYAQRQQWLQQARDFTGLLRSWRDGAVKARLTALLLQLRGEFPALFAKGDYQPLNVAVSGDAQVLAFRRQYRGQSLVVAVTRLGAGVESEGDLPLLVAPAAWGQASLALGEGTYRNVLDGSTLQPQRGRVALSTLFARAPVAVLLSQDN